MNETPPGKKSHRKKIKLVTKLTSPITKETKHQRKKRGVQGSKKKKDTSKVTSFHAEGCGKFSSCLCPRP